MDIERRAPIETLRAYKTELDPSGDQRRLLVKHVGAARWAYNWGLLQKIQAQGTGAQPTAIDLHRKLNALKKSELPWLYEVSKCAPQEALRNLDRAFCNFRQLNRRGRRAGFPRFKSRKRGLGSCRLTGSIAVEPRAIRLPRLGRVRLKERGYLPISGVHVLSATISERAGRWFVSLQVEQELPAVQNFGPSAGVDLGVMRIATVSDGTMFPSPRTLPKLQRRLRRAQKTLSRRNRGSRNRARASREVAKVYGRIANARTDLLHKVTTHLTRTKSVIGIEDLNAAGMLKNKCLAKVVSEAAFRRFREMLEYKARWYGSSIIAADRMFPSSKMCSSCGTRRDAMPPSSRTFRCPTCEIELDRDLNAALNLLAVAVSRTDTKNACGGDVRPSVMSADPVEAGTDGLPTEAVVGRRSRHRMVDARRTLLSN